MKLLYNVKSQNEKNKKVLDTYLKLIKLNNNRSKNIILLVQNNINKLIYEREISLEYSEELKITTYISFVKKELIKYWPIIVEKEEKIKSNTIAPIFISNSLSDYIISTDVKIKRNSHGYFDDITSTN